MSDILIDYQPTPKQLVFHTTRANEVLYGGAAGGGKSKAIVMDALARCLKYPGTHAYLFRRTYTELEDTLIKEAKSSYPKAIAHYNVGRHDMELINGSACHFRHCASVQDMYNYAGAEIHWLYIDELTSFEREIYDFLKTRLRAKKSLGIEPVVRCASNPGNIGHSWVKSMFVDAGPYLSLVTHIEESKTLGRKKRFTTQYIPALATDNPYITDDYIFELERKPKALREALLMGHWDSFEGQVFTEWVNLPEHYEDRIGTHVISPFTIPPNWPRYMVFDHGYSKPFACLWFAVDSYGRAYAYREWYGFDGTPNKGLYMTPRAIARGILEREQEEAQAGIAVDHIADPAIFDRSRGDSVADQMRDLGTGLGVVFRKGDNQRMAGLMQVHERLAFGQDGKPMMYFFDTCHEVIRTLPSLPYSLVKTEDVDTDAEDHCVTGDTLVLTERGWQRMDALDALTVVGHDGQYHRFADHRLTQKQVPVLRLTTEDGRTVTATPNHRFLLASGEWKRLDELRPGDELMEVQDAGNGMLIVKSVEPAGIADVYNMEVEDTHDYVVNGGFVAHNCYDCVRYFAQARPLAAFDPRHPRKKKFSPYDDDRDQEVNGW